MMKLHINEAKEEFDKQELYKFVLDSAEVELEQLEDTHLSTHIVQEYVPGYDPDWCAETIDNQYSKRKEQLLADIASLYTEILLANRKDNK